MVNDVVRHFKLEVALDGIGEPVGGLAYPDNARPQLVNHRAARENKIANEAVMPMIARLANMLCALHFTASNAERMAKVGVALVRFDYWRPFRQYNTLAAIALSREMGPIVTPISTPIVTTPFDGEQLNLTVNASFKFTNVPTVPETVHLIPGAILDGIVGGMNTSMIDNPAQLMIPNGAQRPSTIVLPVPLTEDKRDYPLHTLNESALGEYEHNKSPLRKISVMHRLRVMHLDWVQNNILAENNYLPHRSQVPLGMTFIANREAVAYYDKDGKPGDMIPGTGPLGDIVMNTPDAAYVYHTGHSSFKPSPLRTQATVA